MAGALALITAVSLVVVGRHTSSPSASSSVPTAPPAVPATASPTPALSTNGCLFRVNVMSTSLLLAVAPGRTMDCAAMRDYINRQIAANADVRALGVHLSFATGVTVSGTPTCTRTEQGMTMSVYPEGGDTFIAESFCTGFMRATGGGDTTG